MRSPQNESECCYIRGTGRRDGSLELLLEHTLPFGSVRIKGEKERTDMHKLKCPTFWQRWNVGATIRRVVAQRRRSNDQKSRQVAYVLGLIATYLAVNTSRHKMNGSVYDVNSRNPLESRK